MEDYKEFSFQLASINLKNKLKFPSMSKHGPCYMLEYESRFNFWEWRCQYWATQSYLLLIIFRSKVVYNEEIPIVWVKIHHGWQIRY